LAHRLCLTSPGTGWRVCAAGGPAWEPPAGLRPARQAVLALPLQGSMRRGDAEGPRASTHRRTGGSQLVQFLLSLMSTGTMTPPVLPHAGCTTAGSPTRAGHGGTWGCIRADGACSRQNIDVLTVLDLT